MNSNLSTPQQTSDAIARWKLQTLLGVFKPRLILTPFAIINRTNDIPPAHCLKYKEVFVFGVRIMRVQID